LILSVKLPTTYLCVYAAGVKDASSVNPDVTLRDLGIDSLIGVEVKQTLQRNFGISLSGEEIRALTFAKLDQMSTPTSQSAGDTPAAVNQAPAASAINIDLSLFLPTEDVVEMNDVDTGASTLFIIHPIDGSVFPLRSLMSKIQSAKVYGFQCTSDTPLTSMSDMASHYIKVVCKLFVREVM